MFNGLIFFFPKSNSWGASWGKFIQEREILKVNIKKNSVNR
jgi:hypothetical protein